MTLTWIALWALSAGCLGLSVWLYVLGIRYSALKAKNNDLYDQKWRACDRVWRDQEKHRRELSRVRKLYQRQINGLKAERKLRHV